MNNSTGCSTAMRIETRLLILIQYASVLLGLLAVPGSPRADESQPDLPRASYLGFAPAYPTDPLNMVRSKPVLGLVHDSLAWLTIHVGADGEEVVAVPDTLYDSTVYQHFRPFLDSLTFAAATFEGRAVESKLRIHVRFRANGLMPLIQWPVGKSGVVSDQALFEQTLVLNGIEPPHILTFPPYHANVKRRDSLSVYPYVLVRVDLDSSGIPTNIIPLRSTYPGFDLTMYTACNWATYQPAHVHGAAVPATTYVMISYFSNVSYPTKPLDFTQQIPRSLRESLRVRTLYDTLGLLAPAIPRFIADDSLLMEGNPGITIGDGTVLCLIDAMGEARGGRVAVAGSLQPRFRRLMSQLKFYPALNGEGRPVSFAGPLHLAFRGSAYVRIDVLWLAADNPQLAW